MNSSWWAVNGTIQTLGAVHKLRYTIEVGGKQNACIENFIKIDDRYKMNSKIKLWVGSWPKEKLKSNIFEKV